MKQWSKIERDILHKPLIKKLVQSHGLKGLGIYIVMRNIVDCHDEVNRDTLWLECSRLVRKSLFNEIVSNTEFFTTDEYGFLKIVSQQRSPRTHTGGHTEAEREGSTEAERGAPEPASEPFKKKEREENKKENNFLKNKKAFQKPSLLEVEEFVSSNCVRVNAAMFYTYYESRGWMFGNAPMTDWQAAIKAWETNPKYNTQDDYDETSYINDAY